MTTTKILRLVLAALVTPWLVAAESQPLVDVGPTVSLEPEIQCWAHGEHSIAFASVKPGAPIARLYFRCSLYPDYYFVNLEPQSDLYTAVLPQASDECPSVYYYVEAVSADFASSRNRERVAKVSEASECRRRDPLVALFSGDPRIIVGATAALAPEMAPGFSVAGVVGFISAGGATGGGGGLATAAIAGIGGAAAVGAALVVSNGGDDGPSEDVLADAPTPVSEPGPSAATPPPAAPAPVPSGDLAPIACVATDPKPAIIAAGESIRLDASCSKADRVGDSGDRIADYIWDFSDGRQKMGRVVNAVFRKAGVYEITLTVIDGGASLRPQRDSKTFEVTVEDRVEACFVASDVDPGTGCKVKVDAGCSSGDIDRYEWIFSDGFGNYRFTGRTVVKDWVSCPLPTTVTLTVTSGTGVTDSVTMPVFVNYQRRSTEAARTDLVATVQGLEERSSVRLVVNDATSFSLHGSAPRRIQVGSRSGVNRITVLRCRGGFGLGGGDARFS